MRYRLLLVAIVLGVLALASVLTYAQNEPDVTPTPAASSVIQQDIFVRGGPGRDYLPVGKLLVGDRVRPLSRNATSDWVLIVYGKTYGWIRRDLAFWVENIDALPVMDTANLTPSPIIPTTPANTPVYAATETPSGNWVELNTEAQSGYVRGGPGRTYLRLGQLYTGDEVEPVSQNADGSWIMIRFGDGFGWISRNLVRWITDIDSLPVIDASNLTPTATFTATSTPSATPTATSTFTATVSATLTLTSTFTDTPSATPTATSTQTPSVTPSPTLTQTLSATPSPTLTATVVPSETLVPTLVPSATIAPSQTLLPTETPVVPTTTNTPVPASATPIVPTVTNTLAPSATFTDLPSATADPSETSVAIVIVPSATVTLLPTNMTVPSATATLLPTNTATLVEPTTTPIPPTSTFTPTVTFTTTATTVPPSATSLPATAIVLSATVILPTAVNTIAPTTPVNTAALMPSATVTVNGAAVLTTPMPTPDNVTTAPQSGGGLSPEALIAGIVLLLIGIYGFFYWRGLSTAERYANGFVIDTCPVCGRGHLIVETRQERLFGVPRVRHSVRCSECRSVLREVGDQEWRYAVDPIKNPSLYQQYNGQVITDEKLVALAAEQTHSQPPPE